MEERERGKMCVRKEEKEGLDERAERKKRKRRRKRQELKQKDPRKGQEKNK